MSDTASVRSARFAKDASGNSIPMFPKGGKVVPLEVDDKWTEFLPNRVDAHRVHVPKVEAGRIIYTSTANFPDLTNGAPVTDTHRLVAPEYLRGIWPESYDTDGTPSAPGTNLVRFFFALDGAADGASAVILFERAAA